MVGGVEAGAGRPLRVLSIVTNEISSVLVKGQLGYLAEQGFDVHAATRLDTPGTPRDGAWDVGVTVHDVPLVREPSPFADLRGLWAVFRLIRQLRPDVVNASTPKAGLLGSLAGWFARVPVRVYTVRGFRFETTTGKARHLFLALEKLAMAAANRVVFNSASLRGVAESEGLLKPGVGEVIGGGSGNGVDLTRFSDEVLVSRAEARATLGVPDGVGLVIGFVGRFTKDKGIADLLSAFEQVRDNGVDAHLLLVGTFEPGDPVGETVQAKIAVHDHITVAPWLDDTAVVYPAIDVLAFPSYREGLPNTPLEAQACGVPVVGYAATGTVDAVYAGETGVLVTTGDIAALAAALCTVFSSEDERERLGAAGPPWVRTQFNRNALWQGWADRYRAWS